MMNLVSTRKVVGLLAVCTVMMSVMVSCNKNDDTASAPVSGTVLTVNVKGIEGVASQAPAASANAKVMGVGGVRKASGKNNWVSLGKLEALVDFQENVRPANAINLQSSTAGDSEASAEGTGLQKTMNKGIAAAPLQIVSASMQNGMKYRLLLYNAAGKLDANQVVTTGTSPQIKLNGAGDYTWYAVSINKDDKVPEVDGGGVIAKADLANKDLLYASGKITIADGVSNNLEVLFKRKTAQIQVKIDVRGMFGKINEKSSVSVVKSSSDSATVIQVGDFNIKTGAFSNVSSVTAPVMGTDMVDVPNTPEGTVKYAHFHTVSTAPVDAGKLKIKLNSLKINLDNNAVRSFDGMTLTMSKSYVPTIGGRYEANINLVESPLYIKGIKWARTNLVYNGDLVDKYRFDHTPGVGSIYKPDRSFWNWRSLTPIGAPGKGDPCTKVYPEGTWRMPTANEWRAIGKFDAEHFDSGGFKLISFGYEDVFAGVEWYADKINPNYDLNSLLISFGGYRDPETGEVVNSSWNSKLIGFSLFGGGEGHYWTADATDSRDAYAMVGSWSTTLIFFGGTSTEIKPMWKTDGKNIRCVRNEEY